MRPVGQFFALGVLLACSDTDSDTTTDAATTDSGSDSATDSATATDSDSGSGSGSDSGSDSDSGPDPAALPECAGGVLAAFDLAAIMPPLAYSEGYVVPTDATRAAIGASIDAAIDGDLVAARAHATGAEYELCRGSGEESDLFLWRPAVAGRGQAPFAWRWRSARPLIVEAPHPLHDRDTVPESLVIFRIVSARLLVVSGTHRCANRAPGCSGTSDVCGASPAIFRESDMAHTHLSVFHAAHERFAERFAGDLVVSVHGFADDGVSVSNGTRDPVAPDSPVARLAERLTAAGISGVTACNAGTSVPTADRLCGTANVQGRHVNEVADACTDFAATATERFLHLEQALDVRQTRAIDVATALAEVVPR